MKKSTMIKFSRLLLLLVLISCKEIEKKTATGIFKIKLDHHQISSGDNRPDFNPYKDSVDYFLYALHIGIEPEEFARVAGWSSDMLKQKIKELQQSDFLPKTDGERLLPTCMIITQETGKQLFSYSENAAREIADSIGSFVPSLLQQYSNLSFSQQYSFTEMSFFLLSDVLLDNWQINNVEKEFVNQPRTQRHGKNYFYQIAELNADDSTEVFGIYGNQVLCNDTLCVAVYGNRRSGIKLESYLNSKDLPFITPDDEKIFKDMASGFKPVLIQILEKNRSVFQESYNQSVYKNQISFAEYFMWLYHFIYTKATDILVQQGHIKMPRGNNFLYSGK
jgi:hypothetical protein